MEPTTNLSTEDGTSTQQAVNKDTPQPQPTSTVNVKHLQSSTASPLQTNSDGSSPHRTENKDTTKPRSSSIVSLRHLQPSNDTPLQTNSDESSLHRTKSKNTTQPRSSSMVSLRHFQPSNDTPLQTNSGVSLPRPTAKRYITQQRSHSIISLKHLQPSNDTPLQTDFNGSSPQPTLNKVTTKPRLSSIVNLSHFQHANASLLPNNSFERRVTQQKQLHLPFVDDDANEKRIAYKSTRRVFVVDKNKKVTVERMKKKRQREEPSNERGIIGSTSASEDHDKTVNKRRRLSSSVLNNSQNLMTPVRYSRVSEARKSTISSKEKTRSISEHESGPAEKKRRFYYEGFVADFILKENGKHFGYIRCPELEYEGEEGRREENAETNDSNRKHNDVFFPFENVQSNLLELVRYDKVEFCVFDTNFIKNKHKAKLVKIVRLHKREYEVLLDYLTKVKEMLVPQEQKRFVYETTNTQYESDFEFAEIEVDDACSESPQETPTPQNKLDQELDPSKLLKLVADPTVWQMVTEQVSDLPNGDKLLCLLLEVVTLLHKARRTLEERFRQVLVSITSSSKFFNPIKGRFLSFIKTSCTSNINVKLIQDIVLLVAQLVPEKRPAIIAFIKPMMKNATEGTKFIFDVLKTLSSGSSENIADLDWRDLPLILKKKEIFEPGLDYMVNIRPVQVIGNYDCPEDYMDVYFRLLREDCFNQLKKCIRHLLAGELDLRDMNVYKNLSLVGISLKHNTLYLALRIISVNEIQDWQTCSNLMFGNLLCISIGGSFRKPIWVTVASRDMLKKDSIVIVQSCWEWNDVDDAEILLNLITCKGLIWMVESPTYYRAFQPVLQTLQHIDAHSISFKDELVDLQPGSLPDFLHDSNDFNAYLVHKVPQQERITIKDFLNTRHSDNSLFDESQEEAVKNALKNRIGIIQGPPGCGKSFIGVKMLQLLLSLSSLEDPKVLVLTYKNHALDEFLKGTMKFIGEKNVVRLGGRCKDPELDKITLGSYKKTIKEEQKKRKSFKDKHCWFERQAMLALHENTDEIKINIEREFQNLNRLRYIQVKSHLSDEQGKSLLLGCPWDRINFRLNTDIGHYKRGMRIEKRVVNIVMKSEKWIDTFMIEELKNMALSHWMPLEREFDALESSLIGTNNTTTELNVPTSKEQNRLFFQKRSKINKHGEYEKEQNELDDKQEIEERQRERMSASTKAGVTVEKDFYETFIMVDHTEIGRRNDAIKVVVVVFI